MEESKKEILKEVNPGFKVATKSRLGIYKMPNNLYALHFMDKGNLPEHLKGGYTSIAEADRAGISYLGDKFEISAKKAKKEEQKKNSDKIEKTKEKKAKAVKDSK